MIHFIIFSYAVIALSVFTFVWWVVNSIVQWELKEFYFRYKEEKKQLEHELKRYKKTFGELPEDS